MLNFIQRFTEAIAKRSSRRHFVGIAGKFVASIAALAVGEKIISGNAEAAALTNFCCCSGSRECANNTCPRGTQVLYTWYCACFLCPVVCNDCYTPDGHYNCTYEDLLCAFEEDKEKSLQQKSMLSVEQRQSLSTCSAKSITK